MQIELRISDHMESRIQQRGLKASCWDIIFKYGTYISEDRIMLTKKVSTVAILEISREIELVSKKNSGAKELQSLYADLKKIELLTNWILVLQGNCVITCFPAYRTTPTKKSHRHSSRKSKALAKFA